MLFWLNLFLACLCKKMHSQKNEIFSIDAYWSHLNETLSGSLSPAVWEMEEIQSWSRTDKSDWQEEEMEKLEDSSGVSQTSVTDII